MNFEEMLCREFTQLSEAPFVFSCKQFDKEFKKIFGKDNHLHKDYFTWLERQFSFMRSRTIEELLLLKQFEIVYRHPSHCIYSLRRENTRGNPRILFSFLALENEPIYFFLLAFSEKNTSDYEKSIPVARERFVRIVSALEEG